MNLVKSIIGLATFISLCLGIVFFVLYPGIQWLLLTIWGLTFVLGILWLVLEWQTVMKFLTKKSTRYGANFALVLFLLLGILTFINILAKDNNWRKDITRGGVNSISPQTEKILKELKQKVKISYFARPQEKEKAEQLFKNYVYLTKNLSYEIIDPNRQPTLTKSMGVQKFDTVVLSLVGNESKTIKVEGVSEEKLTNALIKLLKAKNQTIYFTTGHGERSLDENDNNGENYSLIKKELEKEAYVVKGLNLFSTGKIPEDASVLVIAGPRTAFFPKELEILSAWIKNGGHTWLALDLDINESGLAVGSKQLTTILKEYGIEVGNQMLVDPTSKAANVEPQVLMGFVAAKGHVITKDFPSSTMGLVPNFLFPLTTYLKVSEKKESDAYTVTTLIKTTPSAWAESDWAGLRKGIVQYDSNKDSRGEMNLGLAIEQKDKMRFLVFSSSSYALNGLLRFAGNRDLFLNSIAWLADDDSFISIRAKTDDEGDRLDLSQNWMNMVFLLVVFVMPISILGTGLWVWFRRRGK